MESTAMFIESYPLLIKGVIIVFGYFATFVLTSYLIKKIVLSGKKEPDNEPENSKKLRKKVKSAMDISLVNVKILSY